MALSTATRQRVLQLCARRDHLKPGPGSLTPRSISTREPACNASYLFVSFEDVVLGQREVPHKCRGDGHALKSRLPRGSKSIILRTARPLASQVSQMGRTLAAAREEASSMTIKARTPTVTIVQKIRVPCASRNSALYSVPGPF